jgi:hypothetical protein
MEVIGVQNFSAVITDTASEHGGELKKNIPM